jgi:hypothetical protein
MASVEIQLLGRFEVTVDGRPLPASAWRHHRAAGLMGLQQPPVRDADVRAGCR